MKTLLALLLCLALLAGCAAAEEAAGPKLTKNLVILFTSDIHCGIDENWGLASLYGIRKFYEKDNHVLLVDDGDAVQGEAIGLMTKGQAVISLMNQLQYDVAIPGNHEFDFGMDSFLKMAAEAKFPYISCNFNRQGKLVFPPSLIREIDGVKIGFVGVVTPMTIRTSNPKAFMNENGEFEYDFMQDETGERLYNAVQEAVDGVRAQGANYVILIGHMGNKASDSPWMYSDLLSHTNGIDAMLDGHSHDTDKVVMKNKDGADVLRAACGTKMNNIGVLTITTDGKIDSALLPWGPEYPADAVSLLGLDNPIVKDTAKARADLNGILGKVIAKTTVNLIINDPQQTDDNGQPVRIIRRTETNLGDLCADAFRIQAGADIAVINSGGIRDEIRAGDITYGKILSVFPFANNLSMVKVTGQQLLDALEWSVHAVPDEFGGFDQVSGITFEYDPTIESPAVQDENLLCGPINSAKPRRIRKVTVGGEPLDPQKTYTLAGPDFQLMNNGDGYTAFNGCEILQKIISVDNEAVISYITKALDGIVGEEYKNPYGQGRIISVTAER